MLGVHLIYSLFVFTEGHIWLVVIIRSLVFLLSDVISWYNFLFLSSNVTDKICKRAGLPCPSISQILSLSSSSFLMLRDLLWSFLSEEFSVAGLWTSENSVFPHPRQFLFLLLPEGYFQWMQNCTWQFFSFSACIIQCHFLWPLRLRREACFHSHRPFATRQTPFLCVSVWKLFSNAVCFSIFKNPIRTHLGVRHLGLIPSGIHSASWIWRLVSLHRFWNFDPCSKTVSAPLSLSIGMSVM